MSDGEWRVQGVSASELAREFGTPLFVYDSEVLKASYAGLRERLHPAVDVLLSLKANPNVSVCSYLGSLGAGAEVSSLTELNTAQWAGIPPERTIFLGPGKTRRELEACVSGDLHATVCESLEELLVLERIAREAGVDDVPVLLRINPDFHTKGSGLAMGGKPRQFGTDVEVLRGASGMLAGLRRVRVLGFHVYMGTRFLKHEDLVHNTEQILRIVSELAVETGTSLETVDFGGGFGIAYFDNEKDLDIDLLVAGINDVVRSFLRDHPGCRLITELGRYLTALCGTYMVSALYVKQSMGEHFVVTDGGTNHHMAAVGVGSFVKRNFPMRSLSRGRDGGSREYTVTGPLCTPNDVLGRRVLLPAVEPGDLLGVERSGAYGPTASPGLFLSHGYPSEVLVHNGVPHLVRTRDRSTDLLVKQRLIDFTADPEQTYEYREQELRK
ncbi:diaminopimelate decarboxylase [Spinactinospora alkalitolerans]|uniref:Diaminopimelate decarboxylase n=1 Tax=Spinactinospora alkalitolerans TaxID=687207 RepID=A0A852U4Y0_9ACTN|nr:diaminopimelate decarboxylase [Spinactinospora alkalitolerans]NYE50595.1 diaminopimelate decarboxylase [Spinactinospora alkalitolerans]